VVVAMGRYGGGELGLGSDADVMFCYDGDAQQAGATAHLMANTLRELLMAPSTDPELVIDADLRPEGKNGPLVRSLESFATYYSRWSAGWEAQALLRAHVGVGDAALGQRFTALIDPMRYPQGGLTPAALGDIRRLKARMESERLPRGVDPALHLKLGPGALSDVEWVVQILQLSHAHHHPGLRTTRTLTALRSAVEAGLVDEGDALALTQAWQLAMRVRDFAMLLRGRAVDVLPTDPMELSRLAQAMGYGARAGQQLREDYLRATRRSRAVTMRLLYGQMD
jgi:glutamate-ammonia-ligase adenylyltransferase